MADWLLIFSPVYACHKPVKHQKCPVNLNIHPKLQTLVYDILPSGGWCRKAVFGVCIHPSPIRIKCIKMTTLLSSPMHVCVWWLVWNTIYTRKNYAKFHVYSNHQASISGPSNHTAHWSNSKYWFTRSWHTSKVPECRKSECDIRLYINSPVCSLLIIVKLFTRIPTPL